MHNVAIEITMIASIFILGIILCFTVSLLSGIGFILLGNIALPTIIKLCQTSTLKTAEL